MFCNLSIDPKGLPKIFSNQIPIGAKARTLSGPAAVLIYPGLFLTLVGLYDVRDKIFIDL